MKANEFREWLQQERPEHEIEVLYMCPSCRIAEEDFLAVSDIDGDCTNCGEQKVVQIVGIQFDEV